jgi:uncharacterized protein
MTFAEFYLVLSLGFLSSIHCLQMCGPIVLTYSVSLNADNSRRALLPAHLAYNAGRTITYMVLGAIAGAMGGTLGFVGRLAGVQNTAMILAGIAMVVTAIAMFGIGPGSRFLSKMTIPRKLLKPVGNLISSKSAGSKFLLGLLLGLMPCGLVYAALMKAVGTASIIGGALTLLAFGIGTTFALLAIGLSSSLVSHKLARYGSTVASVTIALLGVILIWRGVMHHAPMHHH